MRNARERGKIRIMSFQTKLDQSISKNNSLVCVGLDSEISKLPESIKNKENPQFEFNKAIIDATHDLVCAYKPNTAFYEAYGDRGVRELKMTCDYLNENYPDIPVILDAKRADIGNTNNGYIKFAYEYLGVDAITLHPYLGREALQPFLDLKDKGSIILCKTSNLGSDELQNLYVNKTLPERKFGQAAIYAKRENPDTLCEHIAKIVSHTWNTNQNCFLVVGATYSHDLAKIRELVDDMTLLVPGIGAQGGDVEETVKAGLNSKNAGLIINSSRGIIFASSGEDFAEKARAETEKLRDEINRFRN